MTDFVSSQEAIEKFWKSHIQSTKPPTKAPAILPRNIYAQNVGRDVPKGITETAGFNESYEEAVKVCKTKVAQIVKECRAINQKYSDPYFDLDNKEDCLFPLAAQARDEDEDEPDLPPSCKRVGDIFDNPQFYVDGVSAKDIRQGMDGDCWFLSALATLCSMEPAQVLLERVCIARDEEVGVYGFVLFRDGEWISVIIDDKLYLRMEDYDYSDEQTRRLWEDNRVRCDSEEDYRREFQSNSRALYYAQSTHPDETWVPLLEKAFAKAHGDYGSIEAGTVGEAIEDLTGGVSSEIRASNILSRDRFWDELVKVNKEFLFGCGTVSWSKDSKDNVRDGIHGSHAYSILRAQKYGKDRLLMVKNPWGRSEWNGAWSDGSSQWTAESIKELGHTFGDDGIFWIRYEDLLRKYEVIWRTRLFDSSWRVTQQWTTVAVPWGEEFQDSKFEIAVEKDAPTVIVLSQLDDRYFRALTGPYGFQLSFRVHKAGEEDYIMRTYGERHGKRSTSVELNLEAGTYEVRLKISAWRFGSPKIEDVLKFNWLTRPEKVLHVGLAYDLAHAKGQLSEPPKAEDAEVVEETKTTTNGVKKAITAEGEAKAAETDTGKGSAEDYPQETETPYEQDRYAASAASAAAQDTDAGADAKSEKKDDDEEPPVDPWSAFCVVGLRVYCKDADATVRIVRPAEDEPERPILDHDDPAADASKTSQIPESMVQPDETGPNEEGDLKTGQDVTNGTEVEDSG